MGESGCAVPFRQGVILISGATRSGKTYFVKRMIENLNQIYEHPPPTQIMFCYGIYQPLYDSIQSKVSNITFKKGIPNEEEIDEWAIDENESSHKLIILDDLQHILINDPNIDLLLTQGSHHKNISVIIITQNIFGQGKYSRSQSLNTQYFIIFRNLRDGNKIKYLSRQLYPSLPNKLCSAYEDAVVEKDHGYLVIDMHPLSEDQFRLRTNIFPGEDCIIYTNKKE